MKRLRFMIVLAALLAFAFGCSTSTPGDSGGSGTANAVDNDGVTEESIKSADAKVINDPGQVKAGESYRIEPADPKDPKFQADPRLGGGG